MTAAITERPRRPMSVVVDYLKSTGWTPVPAHAGNCWLFARGEIHISVSVGVTSTWRVAGASRGMTRERRLSVHRYATAEFAQRLEELVPQI